MIVAPHRVAPPEWPNRLRQIADAAVEEGLSDVGQGEVLGNNRSRYIWSLSGRKTSGPWCAAAVYAWLLRASESLGYLCPVERTHNARELSRRVAAVGRWLTEGQAPERGDLVVWARSGTSTARSARGPGHVGILTMASADRYRSVEGNVGKFPALVRVIEHGYDDARRIGFARLV